MRPFTLVVKAPLTENDYARAALALKCSVAAVKTVASVESNGSGFRPDGAPSILFEGHIFSRLTLGRYDATCPTLSYPVWTKKFYGKTWQDQEDRFNAACALNRSAAQLATSMGAFQILGRNFGACGCTSISEFCSKMGQDSATQLDLFVEFILANGLDDELRAQNWTSFARQYNGPQYAENNYHTKMAAAYARFVAQTR